MYNFKKLGFLDVAHMHLYYNLMRDVLRLEELIYCIMNRLVTDDKEKRLMNKHRNITVYAILGIVLCMDAWLWRV